MSGVGCPMVSTALLRSSVISSTSVPAVVGRRTQSRRHPVILATTVRRVLTGNLEGARQGYRVARTELGEAVPPHAVDAALTAYRDEGRQLAAAVKAAELVDRTLRSEPF